MAQQKNSNVALCPECEGPVRFNGKLLIGQKLPCRRCGSILVVVDRKPLDLAVAGDGMRAAGSLNSDRQKDKKAGLSAKKQTVNDEESTDMSTSSSVLLADCPECSATLRFHKELKIRQLIACPECDETLEVVSVRPLELNWANDDPGEYSDYYPNRSQSRYT
jgi:lysine biosynthesis protein LysW